jgi:DNA-binding transcriptional LysR family regulator
LPVLRELRTKYPEVTFSLRAGNSASIYEALARYDIDIGILADLKLGDKRYHVQLLRRDDIVLLVSRDHRLAERDIVSYAEFADETVIIREQGSTMRSIFLNALMAADIRAPKSLDIGSREASKEAVACGFGVAPVLHSEAGEDERCAVVRIAPPPPALDEFVACPRDLVRSPLIRAFLDAASLVSEKLEIRKEARAAA